jgi:hypothetical protein
MKQKWCCMINYDPGCCIFSASGLLFGSGHMFLKIWKNYFESYNFAP